MQGIGHMTEIWKPLSYLVLSESVEKACAPFILKKDKLAFIDSRTFMKKYLRFELTRKDCVTYLKSFKVYNFGVTYFFTLDDIETALKNIQEKNPSVAELTFWARIVYKTFGWRVCCEGEPLYDSKRTWLGFSRPENNAAMAESLYEALRDLSIERDFTPDTAGRNVNFSAMLEDIANYRDGKAVRRFRWSVENRMDAFESFKQEYKWKALPDEEKNDFREVVQELADLNYWPALRVLGDSCYGGDDLFRCDWNKSRDCFLKLMDLSRVSDEAKCGYANTLGYIFYYGRCGGEPDYEKAFFYFSLGAAGGVDESIYKLADMYFHGYYVPKNLDAARTLVNRVYDENLELIKTGLFGCKFADAALRMGNLSRDADDDGEGAFKDEYYYYTLADFAIRKRLPYNHYGDSNVFMNIQDEINKIRGERPLRKLEPQTSFVPPDVFYDMFQDSACRVTIDPLKKGIRITVKRLPHGGSRNVKREFECYPAYGYCKLVDEISLTAEGPRVREIEKKTTFVADSIKHEWRGDDSHYHFTLFGEQVFSFEANKFTRRLRAKTKEELAEYTFASVVFSKKGRRYDYICDLSDVKVGDRVVVSANGEEKEVEVVRLFTTSIGDMPLEVEKYKKVLRKA